MKRITIYQDNTHPVILEDEDESPVSDYTRELQTILQSNNISMIHTSTGSMLIRPNKINSILVQDYISEVVESVQVPKKKEEKKMAKKEFKEDIIKD